MSRRPARGGRQRWVDGLNTTEVQEWAKAQGIEVKDRGRVPAELKSNLWRRTVGRLHSASRWSALWHFTHMPMRVICRRALFMRCVALSRSSSMISDSDIDLELLSSYSAAFRFRARAGFGNAAHAAVC